MFGGFREGRSEKVKNHSTLGGHASPSAPRYNARPTLSNAALSRMARENKPTEPGGRILPPDLRSRMEASFRGDFSAVRIHTDGQAARMNTIAFTQGNDIHIRPESYKPDSLEGRELIGHELTHVLQQRTGRVSAPAGGKMNRDVNLETEADIQGNRAARGESARINTTPGIAPASPGTSTGGNVMQAWDGKREKRKRVKQANESGSAPPLNPDLDRDLGPGAGGFTVHGDHRRARTDDGPAVPLPAVAPPVPAQPTLQQVATPASLQQLFGTLDSLGDEAGQSAAAASPGPPPVPVPVPVSVGSQIHARSLGVPSLTGTVTGVRGPAAGDSGPAVAADFDTAQGPRRFLVRGGQVQDPARDSHEEFFGFDSPLRVEPDRSLSPLIAALQEDDSLSFTEQVEDLSARGHKEFQKQLVQRPTTEPQLQQLSQAFVTGTPSAETGTAEREFFFERSLLAAPFAAPFQPPDKTRAFELGPGTRVNFGLEVQPRRGGTQIRVPPTLHSAHVDFDFGKGHARDNPHDLPSRDFTAEERAAIAAAQAAKDAAKIKKAKDRAKKDAKARQKAAQKKQFEDTGRFPGFSGAYQGLTTFFKDRRKEVGLDDPALLRSFDLPAGAPVPVPPPPTTTTTTTTTTTASSSGPAPPPPLSDQARERFHRNVRQVGPLLDVELARRPGTVLAQSAAFASGDPFALLDPADPAGGIMTDQLSATTVADKQAQSNKNRRERERRALLQAAKREKERRKAGKPPAPLHRTLQALTKLAADRDDPAARERVVHRTAREERRLHKIRTGDRAVPAAPAVLDPDARFLARAFLSIPADSRSSVVPTGSLSSALPDADVSAQSLFHFSDEQAALHKARLDKTDAFLARLRSAAPPRAGGAARARKARVPKLKDIAAIRAHFQTSPVTDFAHLHAISGFSKSKRIALEAAFPSIDALRAAKTSDLQGVDGIGKTLATKIRHALRP